MDYNCMISFLGILVTVLGALVTLLIGWQIYNVLSLEKRVQKLVDKKIDQANQSLQNEISTTLSYKNVFDSYRFLLSDRNRNAYDHIPAHIESILSALPTCTVANQLSVIQILNDEIDRLDPVQFAPEARIRIINYLRQIDKSIDITPLLDFVNSHTIA